MNFKYLTISLLLIVAYNPGVYGQANPVKTAGNVTATRINGQQVSMTTDAADIEITVYSANIVRVRMDKQKLGADFSYAVISAPIQTPTVISQTDEEVSIKTDSLKVVVSKKPFAVAFYNNDGKTINRDDKDLSTSWVNESVTTYKMLQDKERFIGLGEKPGNLDRSGMGYTNWNTDAFGYSATQDPIYSTIPFYIGIHHGLNYGIFMDNSYQSDFNFGASNNRFSSFGARGGAMNYYFIYHQRLPDIISSYTVLTGRMKLPPLWSLGYQQNRYSYYPEAEVLRIAETLREKKIPADGITLDIHHMDKYKVFTWDKDYFPDPQSMTDRLKKLGFTLTVIVDPGVKIEKGYGTYDRGLKADAFAKYPDGTDYTARVWPGWCHFPDFTKAAARTWWADEIKKYAADGVSGLWNDMNEIATWGQKSPDNVVFDFEERKASHLEAHNVYALEMVRASYDGARQSFGKRPFILTRAGYAGLQRYSAIWTGDNRSEDSQMLLGVRLLNSLGLSGVPFTGMDVGGFTGNASAPLFARWMQIGAFNPYFRNHTSLNTKSAEPWTFGEEVLEISRNYINLRYKLLPYLYSGFFEATQNGNPLMRSLAINYTFDDNIYKEEFQNQYLFGPAFLVAPFAGIDKFAKVYFPAGKWYDLYTGKIQPGNEEKIIELSLQRIPVYVKESSIIPMQSLVQYTSQKPGDTLSVHIYNGNTLNSFVYYEDDGESYGYEKGVFYKRTITFDPVKKVVEFDTAEGSFPSRFNTIKVIMHGFPGTNDFYSFIPAVSAFDPEKQQQNTNRGEAVKCLYHKNQAEKFLIRME
jgi:alpha-glucosidase